MSHRSSSTAGIRVPFLDLPRINARFQHEFMEGMGRVLRSGRYLLGEENQRFATEFAEWNDARYCIPLANGLDALRLTLWAWQTLRRLHKGDEVIVPANSFIASALAVTESGLSVAFADVDPDTSCLSAATIEAALTPRTRAVMLVHLYGQVSAVDSIMALCRSRGLLLLEDAAQAHGATMAGRRAGTFGDAGAFSFYPSKNLGALGDAGCVITEDAELADMVRSLGNYGASLKYRHDYLGTNSRMDEIQASFLRAKLPMLVSDNARRRAIAHRYSTELNHPMICPPRIAPEPLAQVWHLYVVRTSDRTGLITHLDSLGIESMIHYPCAIHRQPAYAAQFSTLRMTVADIQQAEVLSLPMSPVMSDDQVDYVIAAINGWPGSLDTVAPATT